MNEKYVRRGISMEKEMFDNLQNLAKKERRSLSAQISVILEDYFKEEQLSTPTEKKS